MDNNSIFNADQIKKLDRPLAQESVKKLKGGGKDLLSYLAGYQVIATANEIFGYGNWSTEIMHIQQVNKEHYEKPPYNAGDEPKKMVTVAYTCQLKLSVGVLLKAGIIFRRRSVWCLLLHFGWWSWGCFVLFV